MKTKKQRDGQKQPYCRRQLSPAQRDNPGRKGRTMGKNLQGSIPRRSSLTAANRKSKERIRADVARWTASIVRRHAFHEAGHVVVGWHVSEVDFERVDGERVDAILDLTVPFNAAVRNLRPRWTPGRIAANLAAGRRIPSNEIACMVAGGRHSIMFFLGGPIATRRFLVEDGRKEDISSSVEEYGGPDDWAKWWSDPNNALNQLECESVSDNGDYSRAVAYSRALVGDDNRRIDAELRRSVRRVARLLGSPNAWRAVKRIAAALIKEGSLSQPAALAICLAERVPFARAVPRYDRRLCRADATSGLQTAPGRCSTSAIPQRRPRSSCASARSGAGKSTTVSRAMRHSRGASRR